MAAAAIVVLYLFAGVRVVRPTSRGLVERFGKYRRVAEPGFHWIVPIADRLFLVNVTDVMVNAERQEIITSDKLNARVDAQVYFKVERSLQNNSKVVVPAGSELVNVIGDIAGVLPLPRTHPEPLRASRATT